MRVCLAALALLACAHLAAEDEPSVEALVRALGSDDAAVREKATSALIMKGAEAEPALRDALASTDPEVGARADQALQRIALDKKIGPSAWVTIPEGARKVEPLLREVARQAHREFVGTQVDLAGRVYEGPTGRMEIWRAIDLLTGAAGCGYELPFDKRIALRPGSTTGNPVVHEGPLRLVVVGVRDFDSPQYPSQLEMQVQCEPHTKVIVEDIPKELQLDAPGPVSLLNKSRVVPGYLSFGGTMAYLPLSAAKKDLPPDLRLHGRIHVAFVGDVVPLERGGGWGGASHMCWSYTCDSPPAGPYSLHVSVVTRIIPSTLEVDLDALDLRSFPDPAAPAEKR